MPQFGQISAPSLMGLPQFRQNCPACPAVGEVSGALKGDLVAGSLCGKPVLDAVGRGTPQCGHVGASVETSFAHSRHWARGMTSLPVMNLAEYVIGHGPEPQASVLQEGEGHSRLMTNTGKASAQRSTQRGQIGRADIRQVPCFHIAPELLKRIEGDL